MNEIIKAELRCRFPALFPKPLPPAPRPDLSGVVLGKAMNGKPVSLPWKVRNGHAFVLGLTGAGKSRLFTMLARQLLARNEGFAIFNPHGAKHDDTLFKGMVGLATKYGRRVHIIDLNCNRVIGFNPLHRPDDTHSSVIVGNVMDALAIAWEGESFTARPTIERNLRTGLTALVELNGTLCELLQFFDWRDSYGLRWRALREVRDPVVLYDIQRLHDLSQDGRRRRDYDQEVIGPANRLARIIAPPTVRAMLGQTENCLDIRAAMDNGDIILVNLSGGSQAYEKDAELLGRLLFRMFVFHSKRRTTARPYTLILDEVHRYLSGDTPTALAELRGYGVSLFGACQWTDQLAKDDEQNLHAFVKGTNTQICMRLRDDEEAQKMARNLIPLNLERPVEALIKPTVIGHRRIKLANASDSTNESTTLGKSETEGEQWGLAEMEGGSRALAVADGESVTDGTSRVLSNGKTKTHGSSQSKNTVHTNGESSAATSSSGKMKGSSSGKMKGKGDSAGQVVWTDTGIFGPEERAASRESRGQTSHEAESSSNSEASTSSTSKQKARNSSTANGLSTGTNDSTALSKTEANGTNHAVTKSRTLTQTDTANWALTRSYSQNRATTHSEQQTHGTGHSEGYSEAFEPILANLPAAVHSIQNELYRAGALLRSLPVATAFISYVGRQGPVATLFTVPPIFIPPVKDFPGLRDSILQKNGAVTVEEAMAVIAERLEPKAVQSKAINRRANKDNDEW